MEIRYMQKKDIQDIDAQITIPFKLGAPSMVYGENMVNNVEILASRASNINFAEILLFHTPELHNLPTMREVQALKDIKDRTHIDYTVHLPASLEIASNQENIREKSIRLITDILRTTRILQPIHYILHIPITAPTLVADPCQYIHSGSSLQLGDWAARALDSLRKIRERAGDVSNLLIENINYSPKFLEPFIGEGNFGFCLDIGHLLLGNENVLEVLEFFQDQTREIHLHGVRGSTEHISLEVLPGSNILEWLSFLNRGNYNGLINLEVFSPEDLRTSLEIVSGIKKELSCSKNTSFSPVTCSFA
jgi:sugar phosphate isomerase/epimerase